MSEIEFIQKVVESFYQKAKDDFLIGYHFRNIDDFESHIPRICAFWEIQLLSFSSRNLDRPFDILNAHIPLKIKKGELGRWLLLFNQTLNELEVFSTHHEIIKLWREKLLFFERVFSKFFSFN